MPRSSLPENKDHQTHVIIASGRIKSKEMKTECNPDAQKRITANQDGRNYQNRVEGRGYCHPPGLIDTLPRNSG
jgi:hypothetical protein